MTKLKYADFLDKRLHTAKNEFLQECLRGALKDKTILLVTHQVDFLHNADLILVSTRLKCDICLLIGFFKKDISLGTGFLSFCGLHCKSLFSVLAEFCLVIFVSLYI